MTNAACERSGEAGKLFLGLLFQYQSALIESLETDTWDMLFKTIIFARLSRWTWKCDSQQLITSTKIVLIEFCRTNTWNVIPKECLRIGEVLFYAPYFQMWQNAWISKTGQIISAMMAPSHRSPQRCLNENWHVPYIKFRCNAIHVHVHAS